MTIGTEVAADYNTILFDLGVTVSYQQWNGGLDELGGTVYSYAAAVNKTWIFFKRSSRTDLIKWGISEVGDAYVMIPTTDSLDYRDRVIFDSEVFEFTAECNWARRHVNGTEVYRYYTLKKVDET